MTMTYKQALRRELSARFHELQDHGFSIYAITLTYKNFARYALPSSVAESYLHDVHKALTKNLVHARHYNRSSLQDLKPSLIAAPERKGESGHWHHHGILALHPDLVGKMHPFAGTNALKQLHEKLLTTDVREAYDIDGWLDYMVADNTAAKNIVFCHLHNPLNATPAIEEVMP